jgi:hypothetical protein
MSSSNGWGGKSYNGNESAMMLLYLQSLDSNKSAGYGMSRNDIPMRDVILMHKLQSLRERSKLQAQQRMG